MPELPEVETIKLGLQDKIIGLKITDLEVRVAKIFQGDKKRVVGAKIKNIRRRAKILIIDLDNDLSLVTHLKLTGQLVFHKNGVAATFGHPIPFAGTTLPAKTTHLIFTFNDGSKLFYNDMRKFGYMKIVESSKLKVQSFFKNLGPEPFTKELTSEKFKEILSRKKTPIKLVLMDQSQIAGVGNIYANEALFLAKINPQKKASELSKKQAEKLYKSLLQALKMGIKYGGSSENAYVNALGDLGEMQEHFRVYGQQGKDCPSHCGKTIKRVTLGGRGTFFCPSCQS